MLTNNSNTGNITFSPSTYDTINMGDLVYKHPTSTLTEEQKAVKAVTDLQQTIREKMLIVQGLLVEMQRESGKHIDFNESFYKRLEKTETSMNEVMKNIQVLTEQLNYAKDMLDAIKTSQEIADGYKEYSDKLKNSYIGIDWNKINSSVTIKDNSISTIGVVKPLSIPTGYYSGEPTLALDTLSIGKNTMKSSLNKTMNAAMDNIIKGVTKNGGI